MTNTITIPDTKNILTLSAAAKRAKAEGYGVGYSAIRRFVAAGFLPYVPNGRRIYIYYPNLMTLLEQGISAEATHLYYESCARRLMSS